MFNGMPSGPQSQMHTGPQPRFNANMTPAGELINSQQGPTSLPNMNLPNTSLPHHFHMPPTLRQMPPDTRQESQQPNQNNIPYGGQLG